VVGEGKKKKTATKERRRGEEGEEDACNLDRGHLLRATERGGA